MNFYRLNVAPDEYDSDDKDCNEWFSSLDAAKKRRADFIATHPTRDGQRDDSDFSIDHVTLTTLGPKALLLAVLNRAGFISAEVTVVEAYTFKPRVEETP